VTNGAGSDAELKTDYITVAPVPVAPVAAFTTNVQSGTAPLTVTFTDQSTGTAPLTYAWDFNNDGTVDSTLPSPPHTYPEAGTYSVKLTVTNGAGNDAELKTDYITVDPAPVAPEAGFTAVPRSGIAPLPVEFTDASTGLITSRSWKFRNATTGWTQYATSLNPSYNFPAGTYDIRLTVTGPGGSNTKTETGYIIVTSPSAAPVAVFTAIPRSGNSPLTVTFTDHSTGTAPLTYAWDFNNDGKNESSLQNPLFTYDTVGTYAVTLTVTNTFGSDSNTKTDYIIITEAPPGSSHAGVALTFDDNAPDNWYAIQGLLKNYNAHVTFFIENFGGNSEDQINTYKLIQANEHEIAFHGTHHIDAQEYLKNHTIDEYLNYEIIPGLELMRNQGFDPIDFAYPYGSEDTALTGVLQGYFLHIRGTAYAEGNQKLKDVDSIFYQYGSHQSHIYGGGIDDITYSNSVTDIYDAIDRAKAEDKIVIFYAHTPVATNPQEDQISYDRLEKVLQYVSKNNLTFYKISEIN
jgi:PKD repeat protein